MIVTFICPSGPHPVGGVTALYEFANGLARRGHRVHLVHTPFFRKRIESLDDIAWFRFDERIEHHIVEANEVDLPHADIFFGSNTSRPELGLPVVLIQGFEMLHLGFERAAFRSRCLKVCIATWLVDAGRRFGAPAEQFEVVAMGIDRERFRVLVPTLDRPHQVGMLYHPHPAKGWDVGRRALELAHAEHPEMQVLLFGTSPPREALPEWMTFVLDPDQDVLVYEVYNRCRVFLQASDYEGFGFTAVEAMASGAALVTTDNGGSRDYAIAEETALVAAPGDADALAAHLVRILGDDVLCDRLAEAGRRFVERFDWDRAAADLEACLERYLADPARYQAPPGPELIERGSDSDPYALR